MANMVYNYIGLMYKAKLLKIGFNAFKYLNKENKVFLVLYAHDTSEKVKNKIIYLCSLTGTDGYEYGLKYELGKSIGKNKDVAVISVKDKGVAARLKELIGGEIIGKNKNL
jgi:ribosomal protein L7Ae-like RNA K-turn-binding protein